MGGPFRGVIFDLDGVLIDSEPIYLRTINEVLREAGVGPVTDEDNRPFIGKSADYTWQAIRSLYGLPRPVADYRARYDELLLGILEKDLTLRPGAARLMDEVAARGLPHALATSSRKKWVAIKLRLLGLENYFDAVVCGEDVERTKPAPDVYLKAAQMAGIAPAAGLAIEDSPTGIAAARAAGLYTVAVRTSLTRGLELDQASEVIESLEDFNLKLLDCPLPQRALG